MSERVVKFICYSRSWSSTSWANALFLEEDKGGIPIAKKRKELKWPSAVMWINNCGVSYSGILAASGKLQLPELEESHKPRGEGQKPGTRGDRHCVIPCRQSGPQGTGRWCCPRAVVGSDSGLDGLASPSGLLLTLCLLAEWSGWQHWLHVFVLKNKAFPD